ncbi:MAG: hypothetical protein GWP08_11015 [Nitrospiraceae bacterium]|nr:hypothetical protein [Nitrospiraceae bacterium]
MARGLCLRSKFTGTSFGCNNFKDYTTDSVQVVVAENVPVAGIAGVCALALASAIAGAAVVRRRKR